MASTPASSHAAATPCALVAGSASCNHCQASTARVGGEVGPITSATAFLAELKQASKTGYALDRGEESETFACVAAPVFDHRSHPVASIWISGPSDRVTPGSLDKLGKKVKQFADQLSRQLGYQASESGSQPKKG